MKLTLNMLLIWACLAPGLSGCGHFDSPVEIHLETRSYRWGDRIRVIFDFEEPPAGVTVPVRISLVGYQLESAGTPEGEEVPVFERSLGVLLNERLSSEITQTSLPSIEATLPSSAAGVTRVLDAPATSRSTGLAAKIQWAIVSRAPSTGDEDREYIDLR